MICATDWLIRFLFLDSALGSVRIKATTSSPERDSMCFTKTFGRFGTSSRLGLGGSMVSMQALRLATPHDCLDLRAKSLATSLVRSSKRGVVQSLLREAVRPASGGLGLR